MPLSPAPVDTVDLETSPLRSHLGLGAPLTDEDRTRLFSLVDRFGLYREDGQPVDGTKGIIAAPKGMVDGLLCDALSGRLGAGLPDARPAANETADALKHSAGELVRLYMKASPAAGRDRDKLDSKLRLFLNDRIGRIEASMQGGRFNGALVPPALKEAARDLRFMLFDLNCERESLRFVNRLSRQDSRGLNSHPELARDINRLADEITALCSAQGAGHPRGLRTRLAQAVPDCHEHVADMQQAIARLAEGCSDVQLKKALQRLEPGLQQLVRAQLHAVDNPTVSEIRRLLQQREETPPVDVENAANLYPARDRAYVQSLASVAEIAARSEIPVRGNPSPTGSQHLSPTAVNTAIERQMEGLQRQLGGGDPRLLRFLHVASIFLDPRDRASFDQARHRLCALVLGTEHPSAAAVEAALPSRPRRLKTLVDELPTILGALDGRSRAEFLRRLDGTDSEDRNVLPTARTICDGIQQLRDQGDPIRAWATGSGASLRKLLRQHVIRGTEAKRHAALAQLERLCCNLDGIRGRRKELAEAVGYLASRDNWLRALGHRPMLTSQQLQRLAKPLIVQLAAPDFGNKETQNAILAAVERMLDADGRTLGLGDRASLLAHLATVVPKLDTARVLNHLNPQGVAAKLIADQLENLPPSLATPVLHRALDHLEEASLHRTAPASYPRTYRELAHNTAAVALLTYGTLGLAPLFTFPPLIKGSRSPQQRLADGMGRYLLARLGQQRPLPSERESLLPVVQRILSTRVSPDDGIERRLQARAVMALCVGGIPLDADAATRDQCINMAVGQDDSVRAGLMEALTQLCLSKRPGFIDRSGVPAHMRLGAGRLLLNMLVANGGELTRALAPDQLDAMRAAARTAIVKATKGSYFRGDGRPGIALALLREAPDIWPDMPEDVKGRLTECAIGGLRGLPSSEVAWLMPLVVEGFGDNSERYGRLLERATRDRLRTAPPETMLALIDVLGHFQGANPERLVAIVGGRNVLGRLTPENQAGAINRLATDFDEITPAGRRTILAFVDKLGGALRADGACMLLNVLSNDDVLTALGDDERRQVEQCLAGSLAALKSHGSGGLDSAMLAAAERAGSLPDSVIHMLIPYARDINATTLRMLMSSWVNDLPYKTADDSRDEFKMWAAEAHKAAGEHRTVMDTMLFLAQQARPELQRLAPTTTSPPSQAVLRAAIPGLAGRHIPLAIQHAGTIDKTAVGDILAKLDSVADGQAQDVLIGQCYKADQAATLEALGRRFGTVRLLAGGRKHDRHGLDQTVPDLNGGEHSLGRLLDELPVATVAPALAAMAVNVGGAVVMPPEYREQFAALLRGFAARAEREQTMLVLDALVKPALERAGKGAKIDFNEQGTDMSLVRALATDLVPNNVCSANMTRFLALVRAAETASSSSRRRR